MLAEGKAVLVEVLMPGGDVTDDAQTHSFSAPSYLSPSLPLSGSGLAGLVGHDGARTVLPWLPRLDATGATVRQGFYPSLEEGAAGSGAAPVSRAAVATAVAASRRAALATRTAESVDFTVIDGRVYFIVGGKVLDPLTGGDVDPETGLPRPGSKPGEMFGPRRGAKDSLRSIVEAFRATGLPTNTPVAEVLERFVEIDGGLRLPGKRG
jgi:hypothetical protein